MLQGGYSEFYMDDAELCEGKVAFEDMSKKKKKPVKSLQDCPYF
jgi:hypothetical protein